MESILHKLGPNKVVIPLNFNEYEETHPINEHVHGQFDKLDDMLTFYKNIS